MNTSKYFFQTLIVVIVSGLSFLAFKTFLPKKLFAESKLDSKNVVVDSLLLEAIAEDEGATVEEIAAAAKVSKPVIYEHFGGKEGLYAVVVDREMAALLNLITSSLTTGRPRARAEQAAIAFLTYIETRSDGFQILVRDSTVGAQSGSFATLISDIASQVENIFVAEFAARGFDPKMAPMYSQMLVGMVALTGQWWLDTRWPSRDVVAAHLVNLAWNGLSSLESKPEMSSSKKLKKEKKVTKKK